MLGQGGLSDLVRMADDIADAMGHPSLHPATDALAGDVMAVLQRRAGGGRGEADIPLPSSSASERRAERTD